VGREKRLAIVDARDGHGRKLLRNFDPKTGQVWTDYCPGDGELAFNVALAEDAKTFSVTVAIVKPVIAEFIVKPDVVE
jgi:hypothetical protein